MTRPLSLLRSALSWLLFLLGDAVSLLMVGRLGEWLYPVYNRLMLWSDALMPWEDKKQ